MRWQREPTKNAAGLFYWTVSHRGGFVALSLASHWAFSAQQSPSGTQRMIEIDSMFKDQFHTPVTFLAYSLTRAIHERFPSKQVVGTKEWQFDFEDFAKDGHCELTVEPGVWDQSLRWHANQVFSTVSTGMWHVRWEGKEFDLVRASWPTPCGNEQHHWIIADDDSIARDFLHTVCKWCSELRRVVLCFSGGHWRRSRNLFESIEESTLDTLVMPGTLKQDIVEDFECFFEAKDRYTEFNVPWKRGVLFCGPPGNGKTHFIRALVHHLGVPCLYVKSFETHDQFASSGIQKVYATVRDCSPCILVLEDLDSLITDKNRSYFLNELDGFERNDGIITIATTNHPEQLDSAILERPSRFDQKWTFNLPGYPERLSYLGYWNDRLPEDARMTGDELQQLAESTESFSFAYLKELCLGAAFKWLQRASGERLFCAIEEHRKLLSRQSHSIVD